MLPARTHEPTINGSQSGRDQSKVDAPVVAAPSPLEMAFRSELTHLGRQIALSTALKAFAPEISAARQKLRWKSVAEELSHALEYHGRPPVAEATLRGIIGRSARKATLLEGHLGCPSKELRIVEPIVGRRASTIKLSTGPPATTSSARDLADRTALKRRLLRDIK